MTDQTSDTKRKSSLTLVDAVRKADTAALITNGTESFPDDSFLGSYTAQGAVADVSIIEPTFKPGTLAALTTTNNILGQCVEIMEVNIDGTGHSIELIEGMPENETEKKMLEEFFDEPYPNKSMISMRRELRPDMEGTGNGYFEVIRNITGDVVLINYLASTDMRLVRYDAPVMVAKTVTRRGKPVSLNLRVRERRYVQMVNGKKVFFREFGSSRELDRDTGKWADPTMKLSIAKRASEILHFPVTKDAKTPYGVPRWLNQLPSILGSRKAEEFNLEFFDSGGLPPVLVVVQGGYLGDGVKETLQSHLSGKGNKHRAAIVEAISSSGSLDSSGSVKVAVERFGAERMQDAMFQQYDKNAEDHVRASFRLPPMFTGRSQDYNFATALTAYMTAEAQVFAPERLEFDERMWWICKALGAKSYTFKSKPMTLSNIENQIKAIELALTQKMVEPEGAVDELNGLTGLHLTYRKPEPPPVPPVPHIDPLTNLPYKEPVQPVHPATAPGTKKAPAEPVDTTKLPARKDDKRLVELVNKWASVLGLAGPCHFSDGEVLTIKDEVSSLGREDQKLFNEILASQSLVEVQADFEGLSKLCGHAVASL